MCNKITLLIILILSQITKAQEKDLISINKKIDSIQFIIAQNEQRLLIIKADIDTLINEKGIYVAKRNQIIMQTGKDSILICIMGACIYPLPEKSISLTCLKKGDRVKILGVQGEYYKVFYNDTIGFALKKKFESEEEIARLKRIEEIYEKEYEKEIIARNKQLEEKKRREAEVKKSALIKKYGSTDGLKVFEGKIWIGMTKAMLLDGWGEPSDINRTVGSWGIHEQWIYGDTYIYLENDILTSWQD